VAWRDPPAEVLEERPDMRLGSVAARAMRRADAWRRSRSGIDRPAAVAGIE